PSSGGVVYFPGLYKCTGVLTLSGKGNISFRGNGSAQATGGAANMTGLRIPASVSSWANDSQTRAAFLDASVGGGFVMEHMGIFCDTTTAAGVLIDLSGAQQCTFYDTN